MTSYANRNYISGTYMDSRDVSNFVEEMVFNLLQMKDEEIKELQDNILELEARIEYLEGRLEDE